jgi:hypothetical protein
MDEIIKISSNDFRKDLCFYFKNCKGKTIYITKQNKIVAEILFYSEKNKKKLELKMAKMIVGAYYRKRKNR